MKVFQIEIYQTCISSATHSWADEALGALGDAPAGLARADTHAGGRHAEADFLGEAPQPALVADTTGARAERTARRDAGPEGSVTDLPRPQTVPVDPAVLVGRTGRGHFDRAAADAGGENQEGEREEAAHDDGSEVNERASRSAPKSWRSGSKPSGAAA